MSDKKCSRCKINKDRNCFYPEPTRTDGLCSTCKECRKEICRQYRNKNKSKIAKKSMKYYQENKIQIETKQKSLFPQNQYDINNLQWVTININCAKKSLTHDDFIEIVKLRKLNTGLITYV